MSHISGRRVGRLCATLALSSLMSLNPFAKAGASGVTPVVLIVMENHSYGPNDPGVLGDTRKYILGNPDAPYINDTLVPAGTLFSNYDALDADSLPNYLHILAGTHGTCGNDSCSVDSDATENVLHLMGERGLSFDTFAQTMPSNCYAAFSGRYNIHHNPEIYLTDIDPSAHLPYGCDVTDVPFPASWPDPLSQFSLVVPDVCHDMHGNSTDCPHTTDQIIRDGDTWLSQNVPTFLNEGAIVVVTFDEGIGSDKTGGGGHVMTVMAGPSIANGLVDSNTYSHDSLLAGLERHFGLSPLLAGAASATPLPLPLDSTSAAPSITGFTPTTGSAGDPVTITGMNFAAVDSVRFNGAPASFTITDDSSITATVPPGATTGPVTVSSPGGTATSAGDFEVVPVTFGGPVLSQHALASGRSLYPAVTWSSPTTAGDLLVATLGVSGGTITAPAGWVLAKRVGGALIYFSQNATSQSGSVTFTLSGTADWVVEVMDWSGMATSGTLDRTASNTSGTATGTTADSGTTLPTSSANEVAIAAIRSLAPLTQSGPTNGFVQLEAASQGKANTTGTYDKVLSSIGTQDVSVTLSKAAKWRGVVATFRGE